MWHKALHLALSTAVVSAPIVHGAEFKYFDSNIDYWHEHKKEEKQQVKENADKKESKAPAAEVTEKFDWKKHLDPNSKEFFREGDYVPPEPFMELVRNPTDENIKNWFAMIQKKNELSDRMVEKMQEYLAKNSGKLEPASKQILLDAKASYTKAPPSTSRYRFRFYFDSQCPHCKRMFATVSDLQSQGYYIEAFQVDKNDVALEGLTIPVTKASKEDVEKHQIKSIPFLLIGDLQKKVIYRLAGYQSIDSVFAAINEHDTEKNSSK